MLGTDFRLRPFCLIHLRGLQSFPLVPIGLNPSLVVGRRSEQWCWHKLFAVKGLGVRPGCRLFLFFLRLFVLAVVVLEEKGG